MTCLCICQDVEYILIYIGNNSCVMYSYKMDDLKFIGAKIKEIRKRKKISQEKLAEMISMNGRSIMRLENMQNTPTLETLLKIAKALDVSITDLFQTEYLQDKKTIISAVNDIMDKMSVEDLRIFYRAIYHFYN